MSLSQRLGGMSGHASNAVLTQGNGVRGLG